MEDAAQARDLGRLSGLAQQAGNERGDLVLAERSLREAEGAQDHDQDEQHQPGQEEAQPTQHLGSRRR